MDLQVQISELFRSYTHLFTSAFVFQIFIVLLYVVWSSKGRESTKNQLREERLFHTI